MFLITRCVTLCSPEMLSGEAYNTETDIFSLACVIYQLITFDTRTRLGDLVLKNKQKEIRKKLEQSTQNNHLVEIVMKMLSKNRKERPTAVQLFDMKFLAPFRLLYLQVENQKLLNDIALKENQLRLSKKQIIRIGFKKLKANKMKSEDSSPRFSHQNTFSIESISNLIDNVHTFPENKSPPALEITSSKNPSKIITKKREDKIIDLLPYIEGRCKEFSEYESIELLLDKGHYKIDTNSTVRFSSNITIRGDDFCDANEVVIWIGASNEKRQLRFETTKNNIIFKNLTLINNNTNTSSVQKCRTESNNLTLVFAANICDEPQQDNDDDVMDDEDDFTLARRRFVVSGCNISEVDIKFDCSKEETNNYSLTELKIIKCNFQGCYKAFSMDETENVQHG